MLPTVAAGAAQDVNGTRFKDLMYWLSAFRRKFLHRPRAELHRAFAEQRDADNDIKSRRVTMPPNRRPWRIVGHQYLRKFFRISRREFRNSLSQWNEEFRHRWRGAERSGLILIAAAEMSYATFRYHIVHLYRRELKLLDLPNELLLFLV